MGIVSMTDRKRQYAVSVLSCQYKAELGDVGVESGRMNERYRPVTFQEKRRHELQYKPRGYEYQLVPLVPERTGKQERNGSPDVGGSAWAMLLLLLLSALLDLPDNESMA
jgi:hypothetical protein